MNQSTEKLLTTGQVAKHCGVNFRTVIRWIKKGYLRATRLPGARGDHRISTQELILFLKKNQMDIPMDLLEVQSSGPKVLIVDDDVPLANSLQRILKLAGYETKIATGGFEAGLMISSFQPALITLDIHMAGMDGLDVLKVMGKTGTLKNVKVVVISGDRSGKVDEAMHLGAHSFVSKPFQREDLLKTIETLLRE